MKDKDELIRILAQEVQARTGGYDSLWLPDYWDEATWRRLLSEAEVLELANGEVLLKRQDRSNDLYFLVDGKLEVSIPRSNSISVSPLASIGPGTVVGEMSFFDDRSRSASVWSRGSSVLFRLRRSAFETFRKAEPELAGDLLFAIGRILAQRLRGSNTGSGRRGGSSAFDAGY